MWKLFDKGVLLLLSVLLLNLGSFPLPGVLVFLACVTLSALSGYWEKPWLTAAATGVYLMLCFFAPAFVLGLPLALYDSFLVYKSAPALAALPVFLLHFTRFSLMEFWLCLAFCLLSFLLCLRTARMEALRKESLRLRDKNQEQQLQLEQRNKELMRQQDYEIYIATLAERNRIAREIHDNVGHMLSRSILQTGALMAINQNSALRDNLNGLKTTLDSAMDSIRTSVHDLHEEAMDLEAGLRQLGQDYTFCPVSILYDVQNDLPRGLKYAFLSIVREALSNTAKHSNATALTILLREHPAMIQLVITDNGTKRPAASQPGIGLLNTEERVHQFHGRLTVNRQAGFQLFITVPKEKK